MKTLILVLALSFVSTVARAGADDITDSPKDAAGKPNCKLTVRIFKKDGSRKLNIEKVHASSKEDCKSKANSRKLTSDDDIDKIQVSYGWES